ncbi:CHAT domain-containing protein [Streptomyces sp. NPDC002685]|uniref:CHAT domain-containing protein n=1 Tax=Streptomyces sp. NPDC002685 TaxID=3154540 RepID=UPI0033203BEC
MNSETELVAKMGEWIGEKVLGSRIGRAIVDASPVTVRIVVPPEAEFMLFRPIELAHVAAQPLAARGDVTLVFDVGGQATPTPATPKQPISNRLRILAAFSLPASANALALRQERYKLSHLIRRISARESRVAQIRVLQYGVTRERLKEIAEDGEGWDVLHLSGHGGAGEFLLEKADGSPDPVTTSELLQLLLPMRPRVKLAVVSACQSAAATAAETLRWLQLEDEAQHLEARANTEISAPLIAVAPALARRLGCAVVAMRYPVADDFAIALADGMYNRLFSRGQTLDVAVAGAVVDAIGPVPTASRPALSLATPTIFGKQADGLLLTPPLGEPLLDPKLEKMAYFPPEPKRFVGRAQPLAEASGALASESGYTTVLLHGMAGGGKTACALELAYRHQDAFAAAAFWKAPEREDEFSGALSNLAYFLEAQLGEYGFAMVSNIATVEQLERFLPKLTSMLTRAGLLLVLDNLETLLTADGQWKDPRWALVVRALVKHQGESRVIMTSRLKPDGLDEDTTLVKAVHALSRDESLLLARELPHLRTLLHADSSPLRSGPTTSTSVERDRALVRHVLNVVQGHPKLLEMADAAAQDPDDLRARLDAAATADINDEALSTFFRSGISALDQEQFLDVLAHWTTSKLASLPSSVALLAQFLCCMEEDDRNSQIVGQTWGYFWQVLGHGDSPPDFRAELSILEAAAMVHTQPIFYPSNPATEPVIRYQVHPGIAQTIRASIGKSLRTNADLTIASYWQSMFSSLAMNGGTEFSKGMAFAGLAATPYLIRLQQWDHAAELLEWALQRDESLITHHIAAQYLQRIVKSHRTPKSLAVLSFALRNIEPAESERLLHDAVTQAANNLDFRLATVLAGDMVNLLVRMAQLGEALNWADRAANYTRQAELGPWTQVADQGRRLMVLSKQGKHERVLTEIGDLLERMDQLPDEPGENETVRPWNVGEAILSTGFESAAALEYWDSAIDLNAEITRSKENRNAGPIELARNRFNSCGPLIRSNRFDEAEQILAEYQQFLELQGDVAKLAVVFAVRADLAHAREQFDAAVSFQRTAIRYAYAQRGSLDLAGLHEGLAVYLRRGGDAAEQRAHRLAGALLARLTGMSYLYESQIQILAQERQSDASNLPSSINDVIIYAERTEGVHLGDWIDVLTSDRYIAEQALADILNSASGEEFGDTADVQ